MAWGESKTWMRGAANAKIYQGMLEDALAQPARNAKRRKTVRPEDMPWEMSRQGLLKHLLNEQMNTRMETVDAYMQIIPPGAARASTGTSQRNACMCSKAAATSCTRTATSRSPTPTTGDLRPRSSATSGKQAT